MKVLQVYKDYYPVLGGIENHVKLLSEALAQRGIQSDVLVTNTTPRSEIVRINGVKVAKAARWFNISTAPLSGPLVTYLAQTDADLINLQSPYPFGEMAYLIAGRNLPMVVTYHSDVVRQAKLMRAYAPFLRTVLRRAKSIIATSSAYRDGSPFLAPHRDKTSIIPLGQNLTSFLTPDPARLLELKQRHTGPLALFVGRLRYYKGLEYLIRALPLAPDVRLAIVGIGPMEDTIRSEAISRGVADRVEFLGEVDHRDLVALYHLCEVFVLPSSHRSEAFGLVQLEAMAAGKPVICTELGTGTSFVNQHGETGLVVPPCDPAALADALTRLTTDRALAQRLGENARNRAFTEFSVERMVDRTLELYRRVLDNA